MVWIFYKKWTNQTFEIIYATIRMLIQLVLIGYVLIFLFKEKNIFLGIFILTFMMIVSVFIMIRNTSEKNIKNYIILLFSVFVSAFLHLFLIIILVLQIKYFYEPRIVIPIAGMIFSNIMNVMSLAIERFEKEYAKNKNFEKARSISFKVALIPQINSLLAVGLVALPGMMSGQILSGVPPLIAVRYQIIIMILGVSGGGIALICYFLIKEKLSSFKH